MTINKKTIFLLGLFFLLGFFSAYLYEKRQQAVIFSEVAKQNAENANCSLDNSKVSVVTTKLDLLKSYTDFILLPVNKIGDSAAYTNEMTKQVQAINDSDIETKFYATGDKTGREQKIIDFLDYLNDSIRGDLQ